MLRLPVQLPIMYDTLTISVSDYDQGGYDDLVADHKFSINEIVKVGEMAPTWIPLYGIKGREGLQDIRTRLPHVPLDTCYKGRLLIATTTEEVSAKLPPKVKAIAPCTCALAATTTVPSRRKSSLRSPSSRTVCAQTHADPTCTRHAPDTHPTHTRHAPDFLQPSDAVGAVHYGLPTPLLGVGLL